MPTSVWIDPPSTVALRIARETYETAALPLSYVGVNASIGDVFRQQLYPRSARETDQTVRIAGTAPYS
jgi:hypothetical protein